MKGGFEPATLESQIEHSTTEPKPLLNVENFYHVTFTFRISTMKSPLLAARRRIFTSAFRVTRILVLITYFFCYIFFMREKIIQRAKSEVLLFS